jgi:hypothetical protein
MLRALLVYTNPRATYKKETKYLTGEGEGGRTWKRGDSSLFSSRIEAREERWRGVITLADE